MTTSTINLNISSSTFSDSTEDYTYSVTTSGSLVSSYAINVPQYVYAYEHTTCSNQDLLGFFVLTTSFFSSTSDNNANLGMYIMSYWPAEAEERDFSVRRTVGI
jgi:hypothetical protein